jgi:glutathione S-transferase
MAEYLDVETARTLPGLRLVLPPGTPGPWAEAAKGLFDAKRVAYARVRQVTGEDNAALVRWTGHANQPQAIWNDEPAATGWSEITALAERLAPEPRLLPEAPAERAAVVGLCHEIAGAHGFGWQRRLMMFHDLAMLPEAVLPRDHPQRKLVVSLGAKYGYSPDAALAAPRRCAAILALLGERLAAQRDAGSPYFVGHSLSALDVYWATFSPMLEPLPDALCAMPAPMRESYVLRDPTVRASASPLLLEHRDFVYRNHLVLPVDL